MAVRRLITAVCLAASLLLVAAPSQLAAPTVHAATFHTNPAPYGAFKQLITPPALLALARQQSNSVKNQLSLNGGGGDDNNSLVALLHPHKPIAALDGTGGTPSSAPGPQGGISSPPPGSLVFNNDPSASEQNETSVTVRQSGAVPPNSAETDQVVGGVNDFRGFYYAPPLGCTPTEGTWCYPARNCVSLSGFSVSLSGGTHLDKSSCLPWVNSTFQPFGDPALDRDARGTVYYGSLGFDQTAGSGGNGIIIERSRPALFEPSNPCQNVSGPSGVDNVNPCWTGQVVAVGTTMTNTATGNCDPTYCTFADKDWVAVDRYSETAYRGDVYVDWNSFTVAGPKNNTSQILLSRCHPDDSSPTGFAYCTPPVVISNPADQFTGGGSYLTVTRTGYVLAVYANFGTPTTLYPIDYRIAVIAPGGRTVLGYINLAHLTQSGDSTTVPCLPNTDPPSSSGYGAPCKDNTGIDALAGVTMRLPQFVKIDVDRTTGPTQNTIYTTFELCTLPQYYALTDNNGNIVYPGNCPKTDVLVARTHLMFAEARISNSPIQYADLTRGVPGQQFFPSVSVDDGSGVAVVTYNSTQDDPFQNMDSVYALASRGGDAPFTPLASLPGGRITAVPYQITKDPSGYFGQGAPPCGTSPLPAAAGCPGYAPENGDYLQGLAYFGRLYTHYTGTYVQKGFAPNQRTDLLTFVDGAWPMNQDDNYLNRSSYRK